MYSTVPCTRLYTCAVGRAQLSSICALWRGSPACSVSPSARSISVQDHRQMVCCLCAVPFNMRATSRTVRCPFVFTSVVDFGEACMSMCRDLSERARKKRMRKTKATKSQMRPGRSNAIRRSASRACRPSEVKRGAPLSGRRLPASASHARWPCRSVSSTLQARVDQERFSIHRDEGDGPRASWHLRPFQPEHGGDFRAILTPKHWPPPSHPQSPDTISIPVVYAPHLSIRRRRHLGWGSRRVAARGSIARGRSWQMWPPTQRRRTACHPSHRWA